MGRPDITADENSIEIDRQLSPWARAGVLAAGAFCLVYPAWDLRHLVAGLHFGTFHVAVIVAGAVLLGVVLIACAVAGESRRWSLRHGKLVIGTASLLGRRTEILRGKDIVRTEIRPDTWTDGPDTFSVVLHLRSGERIATPSLATHSVAERFERTLRHELDMLG